ncbi:hypothetical protein MMA231_03608 (plasmid) [Asticcacaulis sp. MM231]|uniref:DUF885 domain-containing protein n=1 Tax=Asticcacaulis sp. MM231 TaxID=3157666 RepID=UPI0032D5952E
MPRFTRRSTLFSGLAILSATAAPSLALAGATRGRRPTAHISLDFDAHFVKLSTDEFTWRSSQTASDENTSGAAQAAHLPRVDEATQKSKLDRWNSVQTELQTIDPSRLTPQHAEDYAVYKFQIETLIADQKFRLYQRPLSGDTSFWSDLTYLTSGSFHTLEDYRNYLSQLGDFPVYFEENIANMRAGLKRGFTLPKVVLEGRDASVVSAITDTSEANPYYAPFKKMPDTIPADQQAKLRIEAASVIQGKVVPAHKQVLDFLRNEYTPGAVASIAAIDLPDGPAFYQSQIREYTTLDWTAAKIHQIGLDEVTKIKADMMAIKAEVAFAGDLKAFNDFLRTDPQFYAKTPQALLDRAAWIAKEFDGKAAQYFGRLPRSRFAIVPVPDDVAPFYTSGRGGPGIYLVNTYDLPSRPLYALPALTLHELAPGHAMQMPLAAENKSLPPFRQNTFISAYGEGWAVYCERLGDEMGMFHTPYERYGMLSYQMWRAARLVVDTGIHSQGWSREQARQFLLDHTALSTHEVTTEVDRYIAWPAQALSYYLGEQVIWDARRKAEKALGTKFDIRAFHDTLLDLGSVPLPVLQARVDKYIASGGQGPYANDS